MHKHAGFLVPPNYPGCTHDGFYISLDSGYSVCSQCGAEHFCCCGQCPEVITDHNEHVCTITGCVTVENEFNAERNVNDRVGPAAADAAASAAATPTLFSSTPQSNNDFLCNKYNNNNNNDNNKSAMMSHNYSDAFSNGGGGGGHNQSRRPKSARGKPQSAAGGKKKSHKDAAANNNNNIMTINDMLRKGGGENLRNMVESTVIELLASEKTRRCIEQEKKRNENREHSAFARVLREVS